MGCGSSTDDIRVAQLLAELENSKTKFNEQQNLTRFKMEVLVNMLAMEEKKSDTYNKRVETLKWMLKEQGIAEQTLTNLIINAEEDVDVKKSLGDSLGRSLSFRNVGLVDLAGAMTRTHEEFEKFRADIIPAFADEEGKMVPTLSNEEFMKQLYTVTEALSKADIQIVAFRFGDGNGQVSVPEFLEFFSTPEHVRLAKHASAAVRMSLDLLQMTTDQEYLGAEGDDLDEEFDPTDVINGIEGKNFALPQVMSSHLTQNLDRGVRRLLAMWSLVKIDLEASFLLALEDERDRMEQEQSKLDDEDQEEDTNPAGVIPTPVFKSILLERCGIKSGILARAETEGRIVFNRSAQIATSLSGNPTKPPKPTSLDKENIQPNKNADGKETLSSKNTSDKKSVDQSSKVALKKSPSNASLKSDSKKPDEAVPPPPPIVEPLVNDDIDMLSERFEFGGKVHFKHVLQYFNELFAVMLMTRRKHVTLTSNATTNASPFVVYGSEWQKLKASAVLKQYAIAPPPPPAPVTPPAAESKDDEDDYLVPVRTANNKKPLTADSFKKPEQKPAAPPATPPAAQPSAPQPPQEPPKPQAEVVGPAPGIFACCSSGAAAKPNAPEPAPAPVLPPPKEEQKVEEPEPEPILEPKPDSGFDTPVDKARKPRITFQPRRTTSDEGSEDSDTIRRVGLGSGKAESSERQPSRRNHFHRREEGGAAESGKDKGHASDDENNSKPVTTRWK